ncbi:MAG: tartrate dehydrogenase, partial [Armatimonadetes bacterium]|nr:tartrate dehydrogenase [Armatimonadota bacterium]
LEEFPWGTDYFLRHGRMAPEDYHEILQGFDAIFLGALGDPERAPDHLTLVPIIQTRKKFNQYACVRPAVLYPGVNCPLTGKEPLSVDLVVIRENTEGEYSNIGGRMGRGTPEEVAVQTSVFTRKGTERIIRFAFETARRRPRKHVTSVTKSNAQAYSMVFWDEVFEQVAEDYPEVTIDKNHIDAACMNFVRWPERFDVIVASNLFGDILTDLGAIIVGGMGLAPSANVNPERTFPSMFEPVHGSAPDIKGKGLANPIAAILSAAMMLEFLGEEEATRRVKQAVTDQLAEGKVRTPDLGGTAKTSEVGDDLIRRLIGE